MSARSTPGANSALRLARQGLSLLTWLGLAWLLWRFLDWGVWQAVLAPDAEQCRVLQGQGACWGVIHEKLRPLLFGRYPYEEHWRAALALVLMLGAAGAILIKPWRWSLRSLGVGSIALALVVGGLLHGGVAGLALVPSDQWGGLPLTLWLAWSSFMLSLPLGIALAWGRRSSHRLLASVCATVIETLRGAPLVMVLFMAAFMLPAVLPAEWNVGLLWRVSIALTLFSAAYLAEIVRGGLQTVPQEQLDAAAVLGLSTWQTQRLVVLPQALRAVLPALVSHVIGLLKDTSLVMVVSLHELTGALSLSLGGDPLWRPFYLEAYLFVALIYFLMCGSLAWAGRRLERHWPGGGL